MLFRFVRRYSLLSGTLALLSLAFICSYRVLYSREQRSSQLILLLLMRAQQYRVESPA